LATHERIKHRNNKIIPHRYLLIQPPIEQITFYQDVFIVLIKKRLGFNSPVQWRYSCLFRGEAGEQRLKQLVNYDYCWSQSELKENGRIFQCSTVTCKFVADSREFSEWYELEYGTNHITSQSSNHITSQEPNQTTSQASNYTTPQEPKQTTSQASNLHNIDSHKNSQNNMKSAQRNY
ncbi:16331_t:CDS:2, partial [Racocetra persica]